MSSSKRFILQTENDCSDNEYNNNNNDHYNYDENNENVNVDDLIYIIQKELIKYVTEGYSRGGIILPLCEFLSLKNVRYFFNNLE